MLIQLLHFIVVALSHGQLPEKVSRDAAVSIIDVSLEEKPILHVACGAACSTDAERDEFDRKASVCLAAVWFYRESAYDPTVVGDNGTSFGLPQLKAQHAPITGVSLDLIKTNRKESARAGFRLLRHEIKRCGGVISGLGAYASGKCGGAKEKVKMRLALAKTCWMSL